MPRCGWVRGRAGGCVCTRTPKPSRSTTSTGPASARAPPSSAVKLSSSWRRMLPARREIAGSGSLGLLVFNSRRTRPSYRNHRYGQELTSCSNPHRTCPYTGSNEISLAYCALYTAVPMVHVPAMHCHTGSLACICLFRMEPTVQKKGQLVEVLEITVCTVPETHFASAFQGEVQIR